MNVVKKSVRLLALCCLALFCGCEPADPLEGLLTEAGFNKVNKMQELLRKGLIAQEGSEGVPKDEVKAMEYFHKAADLGHPTAEVLLGFGYDNGRGVTEDPVEALKWFRKAAEFEDKHALYNMGRFYSLGRGGAKQNHRTALVWYRKAAEVNSGRPPHRVAILAMSRIGDLFRSDHGFQNYERAMKWYLKAAGFGDASAMHNIGNIHLNGLGVDKNRDEAILWFRKAAEKNFTPSLERLKKLDLEAE